jgi:lipoyl(octanoyl) transferase
LGRVEYEDGLELQRLFGEARRSGRVSDTLLLLEHPPVLTLGRAAKSQHVLASKEELAERGVSLFETNRGGQVTYHGPGQLVGYPILLLSPDRQDVRRYVRNLEEALIQMLSRFGLAARRIDGWTGVWMGRREDGTGRKLAALGVHLSRWLTSHGFALNVNVDTSAFELIVPCGISEAQVSSMERELGAPVAMEAAERAVATAFAEVFGYGAKRGGPFLKTVSVAVVRREPSGSPSVLLLRRTPERGAIWQLVTGRLEFQEGPEEAAARELKEELGIEVPVHSLDYEHAFALGSALPPQVVRESAFVAEWPPGAPVKLSAEHDAHRWVSLDEALRILPFAGLREAARRATRYTLP